MSLLCLASQQYNVHSFIGHFINIHKTTLFKIEADGNIVILLCRLIQPYKDKLKDSNKMKKFLSDSCVINPNLINITQGYVQTLQYMQSRGFHVK